MRLGHTAPAEAYAPDANRAVASAPALLPEWLVHLLARLILFLLERSLAAHPHRRSRLLSWCHDRPDLPPGSTQALAASIRGEFGNAIAWMCLRRGIGPGHRDWPEMSRAIVAFGGSLQGFRPGRPACGLQWWENPELVPGLIGMPRATPAAAAISLLLARLAVADALPLATAVVPAKAGSGALPASGRPAVARVATGPPTGPPSPWNHHFCCATTTGGWPRRPDSSRPNLPRQTSHASPHAHRAVVVQPWNDLRPCLAAASCRAALTHPGPHRR